MIDNAGNIEFPVIGKVKLGGLTRTEAVSKLFDLVSVYIKNPSINLRILNYKICVLGEVTKPGCYTIPNERITLLEALSLAGDLSIYGVRNNILLIHDEDGKKTYTRFDLTQASVLNSSNYYLHQNDVIIVEPNKTKINSSAIGANATIIMSGMTVLLSLLFLLKK